MKAWKAPPKISAHVLHTYEIKMATMLISSFASISQEQRNLQRVKSESLNKILNIVQVKPCFRKHASKLLPFVNGFIPIVDVRGAGHNLGDISPLRRIVVFSTIYVEVTLLSSRQRMHGAKLAPYEKCVMSFLHKDKNQHCLPQGL